MIKGLIRGEGIIFNAYDFKYARILQERGGYFSVVITTTADQEVVCCIGDEERCLGYLDDITLE